MAEKGQVFFTVETQGIKCRRSDRSRKITVITEGKGSRTEAELSVQLYDENRGVCTVPNYLTQTLRG